MTTRQRLKRIAVNLSYLIGRFLAMLGLGKSNRFIQMLIQDFILGWNDGQQSLIRSLQKYDLRTTTISNLQ